MSINIPGNPTESTSGQMTTLKFTRVTPEKSRLETYVDTLAAVANPTIFKRASDFNAAYADKIMENSYALDFLVELGLIRHNAASSNASPKYAVTQRGEAVLKYFKYFDNLASGQKTRAIKRQ